MIAERRRNVMSVEALNGAACASGPESATCRVANSNLAGMTCQMLIGQLSHGCRGKH